MKVEEIMALSGLELAATVASFMANVKDRSNE